MTALPAHQLAASATGPWWTRRAAWIYDAILSGDLTDDDSVDDTRYPISLESIGNVALPGARLAAADPYVLGDTAEAFTQVLGSDHGEVVIARALVGTDHERIAAAAVVVGTAAVAHWDMAVGVGQDVTTLDEDGFFGYGVDAGTGSFGSPEALSVAGRVMAADGGMLDDPISKALFADGVGTRSAAIVAPEEGAAPVAVFSSGWGDGYYPTWLGTDADGVVVVAVTDFLLTSDPYAAPLPASSESESPKKTWLQRVFKSG